jgi:hypothetical protein
LLLYLDRRGKPRYGSTADQGRTGRKDSSSRLWRPARALGTHAKRGPSTGHSAVGLRQGGEMSPDAEATFHRASCTPGNQVVAASDGPPFRQERRPTRVAELPGPVAVCLPKHALCELGDRVLGGDRIVEPRRVQRAPPPPPLTAPPIHPPPPPTRPDPKQTPAPAPTPTTASAPTASMRPAPSRCAWPAACTTSASAEPTPEPAP